MHLPVALTDLAAFRVDTLAPDLVFSTARDDFAYVADVVALPGGAFGLLDRTEKELLLFDSAGIHVRTLGRGGQGPGELAGPMAAESFDDGRRVLIWDQNGRLTVFDVADGSLLATGLPPVGSDWRAAWFRGPISMDDRPHQVPDEDLTRRLVSAGERIIVHAQGLETDPTTRLDSVFFVEISSDLQSLDTVARLPAAPVVLTNRPGPTHAQPAYASRPLLAAGDGFIARAHGPVASVHVTDRAGEPLLEVGWPARARAISDEHRTQYLFWQRELPYRRGSASLRASQDTMPPARRAQISEAILARTPFPEFEPEIVGMFAAGNCLFLSGFAMEDNYRAESRSWWVLNVRSRSVERVVRVPNLGERVRQFTAQHVFTTHVDEAGVEYMTRYPLSLPECP